MPEGDTIHRIAEAIRPDLQGRTLNRVQSREPDLEGLAGRRVAGVQALGKHLLIEFEGGLVLRSHLGMYGSWHRYAASEPWRKPASRASLALWVGEVVLVCFNARELRCLTTDGLAWRDLERHLGPDLIGRQVDHGELCARAQRLLGPNAPLVDVLLDQRVARGIGNVYKSELLYIQRLHPLQVLGGVPDLALTELFRKASELLRQNVRPGPRVTRRSAHGPRLWVYGRRGLPCLCCGEGVRGRTLGRAPRPTYWCETCQS